jgi:hypothetical protein
MDVYSGLLTPLQQGSSSGSGIFGKLVRLHSCGHISQPSFSPLQDTGQEGNSVAQRRRQGKRRRSE